MKKQSEIENYLKSLLSPTELEEVATLSKDAKHPFNNQLTILLSYAGLKQKISMNELSSIVTNHSINNQNMYAFEFSSPRLFGENFAQELIKQKFPSILDPKNNPQYRKIIDMNFQGEYDLYILLKESDQPEQLIKIELKASRAINKSMKSGSYADRAMFSDDSNGTYDMNFQQLKPNCCHVFVFVGVWLDNVRYWVLSAEEVKNHPSFSNQHRASERGTNGEVIEGQLHIKPSNIHQFIAFEVAESLVESKILEKYNYQKKT